MYQLIVQRDKQQHIAVCFCLLLVFSYLVPLWLAILLVLLIGLGKELWDKYYGTGFCWYDMQANIVGMCLAIIVKFLIAVNI